MKKTEQVLFLVLVTLIWWKCALMMRGASEAVWSLQCLLRWKVFLYRRGSADLATDPDLQDRLVSALFMAPSGATSCWRSHEDAISTHNKTEFYLWSKTISGKLSLLPFSQAHTDILIDCIHCLRWSSWTPGHSRAAERDTVRGSNPQQNFSGRTDTDEQTSAAPELDWFLFFHRSK